MYWYLRMQCILRGTKNGSGAWRVRIARCGLGGSATVSGACTWLAATDGHRSGI